MKVKTMEKACPLCGGDVLGTDFLKYYCKRCNILFEKSMLAQQEEEKPVVPEKKARLKYIVSKESKSYHLPGCRYVRQIDKDNIASYDNRKDAEQSGYHACICVRKHGS